MAGTAFRANMAQRVDLNCSLVPRLALRRLLAALFTLAYLLVGFAHTLSHGAAAAEVGVFQLVTNSSDNVLDDADKAIGGVKHCHGCLAVSMPMNVQALLPSKVPLRIPVLPARALVPEPPLFDPPPPKSLT